MGGASSGATGKDAGTYASSHVLPADRSLRPQHSGPSRHNELRYRVKQTKQSKQACENAARTQVGLAHDNPYARENGITPRQTVRPATLPVPALLARPFHARKQERSPAPGALRYASA